jgi:hypothetical protein
MFADFRGKCGKYGLEGFQIGGFMKKALYGLSALGMLVMLFATGCKGGSNGAEGAAGPSGPGITWVDVTGASVQAQPNTGYMADSVPQVMITLPVSLAFGDIVQVSGVGAGGWKIAQNAGSQ